jgi:hypothetical protein
MTKSHMPRARRSPAADFMCKECVSVLACTICQLRTESPLRLFHHRAQSLIDADKPNIHVVPRSESNRHAFKGGGF